IEIVSEDFAAALHHFNAIIDAHSYLSHTPQMATNTLKAVLLAGFVAETTNVVSGSNYWTKAPSILKLAIAVWEYENYYSYSELSQSVVLARECVAADLIASRRTSADRSANPNVAPLTLSVSFSPLGFPANTFDFKNIFKSCNIQIS